MAVVQSASELLDLLKAETISDSLTTKITTFIESQDNANDELKTKYERLRVDAEQKYFDIEQQLISSNNKLETESTSNEELKQRVEELERKYNEAESKRKSLQESQDNSLSTNLRLSKSNEQLELDKRDLSVLLEKRNKEIDRINEEWKELTEKVSRANTEKCEAQAKLAEVQNENVTLNFQNKRLEQEKNQIQGLLDLLDKQLSDKTNELLNVKKEQTSSLLETQSKLEEKFGENKFLQETVEALKSSQGEQASKIDGLISKLKEARNGMAQSEDQFNQELQAKGRLIDLYKTSKEEAENKVKELTSAVEELRTLLKEAATAHSELENLKEEEAKHFRVDIESREETIEKLRQELVNANDLLEQTKNRIASEDQVESMFPTAAVTSKVLKSGMSLTQIYNEYVQASDALMLEKEENQRLNQYLTQILQEIEEKAPLLKKQRQDYENSLSNIEQLTRQLDSSMLESQNLRIEADDINRKYNHMQRENQKLQLQTNDLSKQLRYILKEMAELRGGRVVREVEQPSAEVSSSSQVISDKLVTFRTIEDLQVQNIRLLTVIRELSDKQEQEEKIATDSKTKELKEQLEIANAEIQELKSSRDKQIKMVESIVRQRDMFKVLSQSGMTVSQSMTDGMEMITPVKQSPGVVSPSSDKALQDMKTALTQLQEDFTNYKKEKKENEKIMEEELEKYRSGLSSMTVQNAKMSSQVDYSAEKYKVLQGNAEGYRKEIAALRDKVQKYSASVAKHEQTINILRQDLMLSKENFARTDTQAQNLRVEKELLKQSELRLLQDVESMRRERHSQAMLMANLEAIKNNIEHSESETRNRYTNKIDALEMENSNLTRKLQSAQDEQKTITTIFESQIKEIRSQLEQELENHEVDKKHIRVTQQELESVKIQLAAAETKLVSAETRLANTSTNVTDSSGGNIEAVNEELKDLQSQLEQSQQTISMLRDQLNKSQDHIENYKAIADGLQKTMDEQSTANNQFEQKFEEMLEAKKHAEKRTEEFEKEHQDLLNENIRVSEESHKLNADLRKQLACLQNELQEAVQRREDAIAKEEKAMQEYQSQTNLASEVQDKYQRELILHAADVEALTTIKKQMEEFNEKLATEQECRVKAEKILEESQGSWVEQEKTLKTECGRLQKRIQDFSQQNNLLHQQIEKMSRDVVAVQQAVSRSETFSSTSEDTAKSSEQLLEVVKFLRREKEIAETKLEIVQSESKTVRQQLQRVQRSLEEANDAVREEREQSQTNLQTAAQHAELMRKVENLNLLTDSNRLLRDEKTKLEQQVQTLEAKIVTLEQSIDPLQSSVRDSQSHRDAIGAERDALKNEVERWKSRTNHLIEQANKTDPEEHRKLILEKETIRKDVIRLTEENHRTRAEVSRLTNSLTVAQRETGSSKQEIEKLQRELNASKQETEKFQKEVEVKVAETEAKDNENEEKTKTINQLKKIGRKYKEQAEAARKELDDLQAQQAAKSQEPAPPSKEAIEQAVGPVQERLTATEKERDELKQRLEQTTTESNSSKEQFSKLQQELTQSKEEHTKVKEENTDYEKKLNQSRNVLQAAKKKIGSQNEQIEKLTTEMNDVKQKLAVSEKQIVSASEKMKGDVEQRVMAVKSDLEEKLSKMEKELTETRVMKESAGNTVSELQAVIQRSQEENTELQTKIQQLLKQIESQQTKSVPPQPQVARPSATVTVERVSAPTSEAPKTANIRPMASPVPVTPRTQPAQIQPQSAATKATASIRPMAIAPTTVAPSSGPTPTATVMPTTVSVQDNQESSQVSQLSPALARPTQHVQRVTPQVETGTEQTAVITESEVVSGHTETVAVDPQPSTSAFDNQATSAQLKRSRDDMEGHDEETESKRTRVSPDQPGLPSITVTDEHANTMSIPEHGGVATQDPEVTGSEVPSDTLPTQIFESSMDQVYDSQATMTFDTQQGQREMTQEMTEERNEMEEEEEEDDDDAVIVVESDEEDDEEAEDYDEDDDNEGYNEDMGDYDEDDEDDDDEQIQDDDYQELPEGQDEGGEEEYQSETQAGDMHDPGDEGDDEVVIVDDEENDNQMEPQEPEVPPVPQVVAPSVQTPVTQRSQLPFHAMERQVSCTRTQLAPFVLAGHAGGFEDGEDCIVPSTPTLFVPNRGDGGFAEAVSSPQIPHQRFTFTSNTEAIAHHDLGQLESQEALGMDDTQVDLSQLEEGQGHSVPTTPIQQAPTVATSGESADPIPAASVVDDTLTTDSGPEIITTDTAGESTPDISSSAAKVEPSEASGGPESESATAGPSSAGSDPQSSAFGQAVDKSDAGKAKKIQPIVWEQTGMQIQTVSHTQPPQQMRGRGSIRVAGQTRGMMQHPRGHRGYNRPRAPTPRGTRNMRGGRGGNYRPPMY
ncbi:nucleoprotein TPR-like [Ylistrum balloti]|uniref:nucleoprotein TPR-like n=1 Tax=Ylistrum balloti TaxID=509963 RepID=UPI002905B928|nr:nucleoprotein TPR-like [Ylistrum balloti]